MNIDKSIETLLKIDEFALKESCSPSDYEHIKNQVIFGFKLSIPVIVKLEKKIIEQQETINELTHLLLKKSETF